MEIDFAFRSQKTLVKNLPAGSVIKYGTIFAIKTDEGKEFVNLKSGEKFHIEGSGEVDKVDATLFVR